MGKSGKKVIFNKEKIIEGIENGTIDPSINGIARYKKCNWLTAKKFVEKNQDILQIFEKAEEKLIEDAKAVISDALKNGNMKIKTETAKWLLARRDKKYSETHDIKLDGDIKITIKRKEDGE